MTTSPDRELQQWIETWQADEEAPAAPEAIRRHVARRSAMLAATVTGEVLLGAGMLAFLLHRVVTQPDPVEKVAMGLLALIALAAGGFSLWNWRGAIRSTAGTTAAFLALSADRSRRLRRAIRVGWAILAAEIAVFVPWVSHRLYGGAGSPSAGAEWFAWSFLASLTALAVALLTGLHAWARREARILDDLRRELGEGDQKGSS
jgi:hypothetical protein